MVTKSDYIEAKDASLDASVVILTYNGEQHIDEILASLTTQRFDGTYEILVIDSGSTDSTLDLIAKYPSVRLVQILTASSATARPATSARTWPRAVSSPT